MEVIPLEMAKRTRTDQVLVTVPQVLGGGARVDDGGGAGRQTASVDMARRGLTVSLGAMGRLPSRLAGLMTPASNHPEQI